MLDVRGRNAGEQAAMASFKEIHDAAPAPVRRSRPMLTLLKPRFGGLFRGEVRDLPGGYPRVECAEVVGPRHFQSFTLGRAGPGSLLDRVIHFR